jgi:hypothetical protein
VLIDPPPFPQSFSRSSLRSEKPTDNHSVPSVILFFLTRRKYMNAKQRIIVMFLLAVGLVATTAGATSYNCTTAQLYSWQHGKINQNPALLKIFKHLRFLQTDETSAMLENRASDDDRGGSMALRIENKADAHNDLVAVSKSLSSRYIQKTIMRIRAWDRNAGLSFVLITDGGPDFIASGRCTVDEDHGSEEQPAD